MYTNRPVFLHLFFASMAKGFASLGIILLTYWVPAGIRLPELPAGAPGSAFWGVNTVLYSFSRSKY